MKNTDIAILICIILIFITLGCCCKNELFGNVKKPKTIKLGDMAKLWKKKREFEGVKLTDKQAKDEWIKKVKDYINMRKLRNQRSSSSNKA